MSGIIKAVSALLLVVAVLFPAKAELLMPPILLGTLKAITLAAVSVSIFHNGELLCLKIITVLLPMCRSGVRQQLTV